MDSWFKFEDVKSVRDEALSSMTKQALELRKEEAALRATEPDKAASLGRQAHVLSACVNAIQDAFRPLVPVAPITPY